MDFAYESQGTNTYLVYEIKSDDEIDSMSFGMLTNNTIMGFAPTFFTQMDAKKYIKYNVSGKISVKQFFDGVVNKKRLIGVFEGIVDGLLSAEDYMIDMDSIILDINYIFANVSTCEASLICLPVSGSRKSTTDLGLFFKNIMFSTQFDQTENCDYIAKVINFLNGSPIIVLNDFKVLLQSIKKEMNQAQPVPQAPVVKPYVNTAESVAVNASIPKPVSEVTQVPVNATPVSQPKDQNIPPVQSTNNSKSTAKDDAGKEIGMLDLLLHYSKENVELYKSQKAQKKGTIQPAAPKQQVSRKQPESGVAPSFAIPGQAAPAPAPAVQSTIQSAQPSKVNQGVQPQLQAPAMNQSTRPAFVPRQAPQGKAANFGETTVLGGNANGETSVLIAVQSPTQMMAPHLIRAKNNEKISLNKPVFRVGKEKSYVDYCIGDNTAISRSHANFVMRDGEYFVIDTNSKNHTYVNGVIIQSNVETKISHGDKVRLADEDFEFRLY